MGFWPLTNLILVFRPQTTVKSFIKFDSKLRPQERWQTHRQTDRQTEASDLITCPMLCYSNETDNNNILNKKAQLTLSNPRDVKACKIAPIRRVSFQFTEFHFPKLPMHSFTWYVQSGSRPILLYTVWNPVFANYKVSCLNYKYLVYRLFS